MAASVKLGYTHTRLLVSDFPACFRFYRDVLGLKPNIGDEGSQYAEFRMDNIVLALFADSEMAEVLGTKSSASGSPQVVLCMRVDSVDGAVHALKARGVQFLTEPRDRPEWSIRTAHLQDPDGNVIELNHPL